MHAGFPCFTQDIQKVMQLGANSDETPKLLESAGGTVIASGIAVLLKLGFGFIMRNSLVDAEQAKKANSFFEDNFVITDPYAPNGRRFYQGKFLIRTQKPGDDMNVWLRFCNKPDELFVKTPFGEALNPLAVVDSKVLKEHKANQIAKNPDQVDLVISFRDLNAMLGLVGRANVGIVGLLLENVVLLKGNVGHLFKLGAIAKDIELSLPTTFLYT